MQRTLDDKEKAFVKEYVENGYNGTLAVQKIYNVGKDVTACTRAIQLLKNKRVQEAIDQTENSFKRIARDMNLDRQSILVELKKIILGKQLVILKNGNVAEIEFQAKDKIAAITLLVKLTGDYTPERKELEVTINEGINITNMNEFEIIALQKVLLAEL